MSKKIMKRSLALGALMAFVITGSAMADAVNVVEVGSNRYHELQGETNTVGSQNIITGYDNKALGGWYNFRDNNSSNTVNTASTPSTNLTINGGIWDTLVGGHYADKCNYKITSNLTSTFMEINGEQSSAILVVGGSIAANASEVDYKTNKTESTTLIINNGTFGRTELNDNCPATMIIAGDSLKWTTYNSDGRGTGNLISSIGTTNLEIKGATFNSVIIGGSAAIEYYSASAQEITATVGTANTTINGGEFNKPIVAGGLAWGQGKTSTVGTANLTISGAKNPSGLKINADIFSGGIYGYLDDVVDDDRNAQVTTSKVEIDTATVKNIYGTALNWNTYGTGTASTETFTAPTTDTNKHVDTDLTLTDVIAQTVEIPKGTVTLSATADGGTSINKLSTGNDVEVSMVAEGVTTDALDGNAKAFVEKINITIYETKDENGDTVAGDKSNIKGRMKAGKVVGDVIFTLDDNGEVASSQENENVSNLGISNMAAIGLMSWRAETNDMNKRMGELRNANGEHGVWVRMVRGEDEYGSVKNQYNQYQLGYDEKLSVDKRWTVGAALSYTDAENSFAQGNGESTNKALSIYGSKLNDDGTFVDLIAKYARLENDFKVNGGAGDAEYGTNGYSISAEFGKRIQQGKGLWIEPQVELTYGKVSAVNYVTNGVKVVQEGMDSIVGRVGFSLGKDIKQGNIYARASYLYDFDGETKGVFSDGTATRKFEDDLGGGWWEVGVGANINLSKATYIYADIEKTFGGEVDTNWQWNLGVRYSF